MFAVTAGDVLLRLCIRLWPLLTADDPVDISGRRLITILIRIIGTCANRRRDEAGFRHLRVYTIDARAILCRGTSCCDRFSEAFAVSDNNTIFCGYQ